MKTQKTHTLVGHVMPDTECLTGLLAMSEEPIVRKALGIVDRPQIMFVPAGKLRRRDWERGLPLSAAALERRGYRFFDCGGTDETGAGAEFDQHALPGDVFGNTKTSLELLTDRLTAIAYDPSSHLTGPERVELLEFLRVRAPLYGVINDNDRSGTGVSAAPRKDAVAGLDVEFIRELGISLDAVVRKVATHPALQPTPMTEQSLRNLVGGWNEMNKERPHAVLAMFAKAFAGMVAAVRPLVASGETFDARELFRLEDVLDGYALHCAGLLNEAEADRAVQAFARDAMGALKELERLWKVAEADLFDGSATLVTEIDMLPQAEDRKPRRAMLVAARSESPLFGKVARRGNADRYEDVASPCGPTRRVRVPNSRPQPDLPYRPKADVVIQFHGQGRFGVYGRNGMDLGRVALGLRMAQMLVEGVALTPAVLAQLAEPGNYAFVGGDGSVVQALYFANFRSAVGNAFRANPYMPRCPLTEQEVRRIVRDVLSSSYEESAADVVTAVLRESRPGLKVA